jgi:hypothetical protein
MMLCLRRPRCDDVVPAGSIKFVVIVGIRYFLDPEPYEQLYLPPHVIVMILRFSPEPVSPYSQIL